MLKLMTKGKIALDDFRNDLEGASLIEYTVLIGLLTAAVVLIINTMATTVVAEWTQVEQEIAK